MRRVLALCLLSCGGDPKPAPVASPRPAAIPIAADAGAQALLVKKEGPTIIASGRGTWVVLRSGRVASWGVTDPDDDATKAVPRPRVLDGVTGITGLGRTVYTKDGEPRVEPCLPPGGGTCGEEEKAPSYPPIAELQGKEKLVAVSLNEASACVVTNAGEIRCRGAIANELDPRATLREGSKAVRSFGTFDDVVEIAVGDLHACVLRRSGDVLCFGHVSAGLLGDGRTWERPPGPVRGIDDATAVTLYELGGCALRKTGRVACWGLPTGGVGAADLAGVESALRFVAHGDCVVRTDGKLQCWKGGTPTVVDVTDAKDADWIPENGLCVARAAGIVECHDPAGKKKKQTLARGAGAFAIAGGYGTSAGIACVLLQGARLRCWSTTEDLAPITMSVPKDAVAVRAGGLSMVGPAMHDAWVSVRTASGVVLGSTMTGAVFPSWMDKPPGQPPPKAKPGEGMAVSGALPEIERGIARDSGGWRLHTDGHVTDPQDKDIEGITDGVDLATNDEGDVCVVRKTGAISCWGKERGASLGRGESSYASKPVKVTLPEPPLL